MPRDLDSAETEILVPVTSNEEDVLLDETLNRFAQSMESGPDAEHAFVIVHSEYSANGLIKKVIFEEPAPAARFRNMWQAAQNRLHG
jgi:hypothetical protein